MIFWLQFSLPFPIPSLAYFRKSAVKNEIKNEYYKFLVLKKIDFNPEKKYDYTIPKSEKISKYKAPNNSKFNFFKDEKEKSSESVLTPEEQIEAYLENNKGDHYNFEEERSYAVSSGSLLLDIEMGGGIGPGIIRASGITEGGKTSCALSFAKTSKNRRIAKLYT